jgi:hypothetical protein
MFDENSGLQANINGSLVEVSAKLFKRDIGGQDYSFGPIRRNGSSMVLDWVHSFCDYKCKFCFKEYDWAVLVTNGAMPSKRDRAISVEKNLETIDKFITSGGTKDTSLIWLCTGSLNDYELEREQHFRVLKSLKNGGYAGRTFLSMAPPKDLVFDKIKALEVFSAFKEAGLSRNNSGMELVDPDFRKNYIKGFKGTLTCQNYYNYLSWAKEVFGKEVGSCVLVGLEPQENSLYALEEFANRGIQPVPTIYTSFIREQLNNPVHGSIDDFVFSSLKFKEIVSRYGSEPFNSVFGLI